MKRLVRSSFAVAGAVLLSFCDSSQGSPDGGSPGAGTIKVHGKVLNSFGQVSADVRVIIKSGTAFSVRTRTDSNGNFTVADVPAPYDATVIGQAGNAPSPSGATVSLGLTTATPTVLDMFGWSDQATGGSALLSGAVTGGIGFPSPPDYRTSVLFSSPEVQTLQNVVADNSTGAYVTARGWEGEPIALSWLGPTTTTGTLHALQWEQRQAQLFSPDVPISYSGYGSKANVSLANGSTVAGEDIALRPVTPATFSGRYTAPPSYSVDWKLVALKLDRGLMLIVEDTLGDYGEPFSAFSYTTPNIPGATLVMLSMASNGPASSIELETGLAVDATGVDTTSPPAAELSLPLDRAAGVTTATGFSWTAVPGVVHLLRVTGPTTGNPDLVVPWYYVLTSGTSATIQDLTSDGLSLPASTTHSWQVFGVGPYADIEAASAGIAGEHYWYFNLVGLDLMNTRPGGFVTVSASRSFTTAR